MSRNSKKRFPDGSDQGIPRYHEPGFKKVNKQRFAEIALRLEDDPINPEDSN